MAYYCTATVGDVYEVELLNFCERTTKIKKLPALASYICVAASCQNVVPSTIWELIHPLLLMLLWCCVNATKLSIGMFMCDAALELFMHLVSQLLFHSNTDLSFTLLHCGGFVWFVLLYALYGKIWLNTFQQTVKTVTIVCDLFPCTVFCWLFTFAISFGNLSRSPIPDTPISLQC